MGNARLSKQTKTEVRAIRVPDGSLLGSVPALWSQLSHDLRQPLQSVLLLTHVVAAEPSPSQRSVAARSMENALLTIQAMLDHVAWLSQVETGVASMRTGAYRLADVFDRVVTAIADASAPHAALVDVGPTVKFVTVDARVLEAVLVGLVWQAFARSDDTPVSLSTRRRKGQDRLEVAYTGAPPALSRDTALFAEIPPAREPKSSPQPGGLPTPMVVLGLGLIERLLAAMGAHLQTQSTSDARQRFVVTLPS